MPAGYNLCSEFLVVMGDVPCRQARLNITSCTNGTKTFPVQIYLQEVWVLGTSPMANKKSEKMCIEKILVISN